MTLFMGWTVPGTGELAWTPMVGRVEEGPMLAPGTPGTRQCRTCWRVLRLDMFYRAGVGEYRRARCRTCYRDQQRWQSLWHPDRVWASHYRDRSKRSGHTPVVEIFTLADVLEAYGEVCWHCTDGMFEQLDHYPVPVADGGPHKLENVRPSCEECNSKRGLEDRRRRAAERKEEVA